MAGRTSPDTIRERAHGNTTEARLWLRAEYARLRKRLSVRYPPWADVAAEMTAAGLMGGTKAAPKPLTARAVERMWKGVRRDIEADAARRTPKPPAAATRWAPDPIPPKSPPTEKRPPEGGTLKGQAMLDDVWATMQQRSGRG